MSEGTPIIIKKKKVSGGHGHHGGSWKVAYADFVTAMMAFFMVMWIMGLSDSSRTTVQGYFNDPVGFMKTMPRSRNVITAFQGPPTSKKKSRHNEVGDAIKTEDNKALKKLKNQIKKIVDGKPNGGGGNGNEKEGFLGDLKHNVEVTLTREGLRIELVEDAGAVFFDTGSAAMKPAAKVLATRIGKVIAQSKRQLYVEGHTDARRYQGYHYDNWDLSHDRANTLRRVLMDSGIVQEQVQRVTGYADRKLKVPEDPLNYKNRRVSILLPYQTEDTVLPIKEEEKLLRKNEINDAFRVTQHNVEPEGAAKIEKREDEAVKHVEEEAKKPDAPIRLKSLLKLVPDELKTPEELKSGKIGPKRPTSNNDRHSIFPWR